MCLPKEEGGLGFRSLFDVSKALCAKLWWRFRTSNTLWANFMWNKYCKKQYPQYVQWKGGTQVWKLVLEARENIEQLIWWETKNGTSNIWFDNWTKLSALHYVLPDIQIDESIEDVKDLIGGNEWNVSRLQQLLPADVVEYILEELELREISEQFLVHGTCLDKEIMLWKFKLPVDEVLATIGINIVSRCCCCIERRHETIDHMFLIGDFAKTVWNWFSSAAGILMNCCQIWKWRNTRLLGGNMSMYKVLHESNQNIHLLRRIRFPSMQNIPDKWPDFIDYFESFRPVIRTLVVKWQLPAKGWFKCNTGGAARGNSGPSYIAFCDRNEEGNLIYTAGQTIANGNILIAEALAIKKGVDYCISHQLVPLVVETDSLAMKMFISGTWEVPWSITLVVQEINRLMRGNMVIVEHIYREGNGLADILTNYVFDFAGTQHFHNFQDLPIKAKRLFNMDKAQIPNLKIRHGKDNRL
ncbi:uncharacterized protein LOC132601457 [Lycium barbarum]|uniref:uncharacterized protein LOC132601457 n=1 Tax=Lycium barbarum TaxID=112863 RepID=UPI00293EEC5C|nr:uncharacterized protein LOC132601457 [Lycium barbarum]